MMRLMVRMKIEIMAIIMFIISSSLSSLWSLSIVALWPSSSSAAAAAAAAIAVALDHHHHNHHHHHHQLYHCHHLQQRQQQLQLQQYRYHHNHRHHQQHNRHHHYHLSISSQWLIDAHLLHWKPSDYQSQSAITNVCPLQENVAYTSSTMSRADFKLTSWTNTIVFTFANSCRRGPVCIATNNAVKPNRFPLDLIDGRVFLPQTSYESL